MERCFFVLDDYCTGGTSTEKSSRGIESQRS